MKQKLRDDHGNDTTIHANYESGGSVPVIEIGSTTGIFSQLLPKMESLMGTTAGTYRMPWSAAAKQPILKAPDCLQQYLIARLRHNETQKLLILCLDTHSRLLGDETHWWATRDLVMANPLEVLRRSMKLGATSVAVVHNQPGDNPGPSLRDIALTEELVRAGAQLRITVTDHLIVADGAIFSFCKEGLAWVLNGQESMHPPPGALLH